MAWQLALGIDLDVPDDFGHWFAGMVDGEGSFTIRLLHRDRSIYASVEFHIKLRDDDAAILHEIKETLGIGRLYSHKPASPNAGAQLLYQVYRIGDIIHVLIPLFEEYPLRSKKRRDFILWKRAARMIHLGQHLTASGHEEILQLKKQMEEGRKYQPSEGDTDALDL